MDLCPMRECRYHTNMKRIGNCVLKNPPGEERTMTEIAHAEGVSKQRVEQVIKSALAKVGQRMIAVGDGELLYGIVKKAEADRFLQTVSAYRLRISRKNRRLRLRRLGREREYEG